MPKSPSDHHESIPLTLDIDETPNFPTLVAVCPLDFDPDCFHFSNPSELGLSIPYPAMIVEESLSLYCPRIQAEYISHMPTLQSN